MYVCMYVCMHLHRCVCVCTNTHAHACTHACILATNTHINTNTQTHTHIFLLTHKHIHTYTKTNTHTHTFLHAHTHTYTPSREKPQITLKIQQSTCISIHGLESFGRLPPLSLLPIEKRNGLSVLPRAYQIITQISLLFQLHFVEDDERLSYFDCQ